MVVPACVSLHNHLCQVNGLNGGDIVFVRCLCVCNFTKMVKGIDFKFGVHVPTDSSDMTHSDFSGSRMLSMPPF